MVSLFEALCWRTCDKPSNWFTLTKEATNKMSGGFVLVYALSGNLVGGFLDFDLHLNGPLVLVMGHRPYPPNRSHKELDRSDKELVQAEKETLEGGLSLTPRKDPVRIRQLPKAVEREQQ